MTNLL